jgi:hypothetical protein
MIGPDAKPGTIQQRTGSNRAGASKKENMKVYLSGKISGLHIAQAETNFANAEIDMHFLGHETVNPLKICPYHPDLTWDDYMAEDIKALLKCDAIYLQRNWGQSKGARIERAIAIELGLQIIYQ